MDEKGQATLKTTTRGGDTPNPAENEENGGEKTFTQEQVNSFVSKRLKEEAEKAKEKSKSDIDNAVKNALTEYERKAKLSEEQKRQEEQEALAKKHAEKETELTLRERTLEAKDMLLEKNIPASLVGFVVDADEKTTKENIALLEKEFSKAVETGVKTKLKGKPPEDYGGGEQPPEKKGLPTFF